VVGSPPEFWHKKVQKAKYTIIGFILAIFINNVILPVLAVQIDVVFNAVNITMNGKQIAKSGENYTLDNGTQVPFSILYNGTTYLPLRKLGELYDKDILWDGNTSTASINDYYWIDQNKSVEDDLSTADKKDSLVGTWIITRIGEGSQVKPSKDYIGMTVTFHEDGKITSPSGSIWGQSYSYFTGIWGEYTAYDDGIYYDIDDNMIAIRTAGLLSWENLYKYDINGNRLTIYFWRSILLTDYSFHGLIAFEFIKQ
jgi:hypothetical protein